MKNTLKIITFENILLGITIPIIGVAIYMIFMWVPTEQTLGISQRIFYIHVPSAWTALLSVVIVAIGSLIYLINSNEKWDSLAHSAGEVGVILASLTLLSGIIWAKPIWGVWWTWDARLTTTLILWFILVAYLMLRSYAPTGPQGKRFGAILGVLALIDAPIVYYSTVWWRTAHPGMNIGPLAESATLDSQMYLALMVSVVGFTLLFVYILKERYNMKQDEKEIDKLFTYYG